LRCILAVVLLIVVGPCAWACYSGLTLIPTVDTVGAGMLSIEGQVDSSTSPIHAETYILNTEFGIGERLEVGLDFDLSDGAESRVLLNGKYVLFPYRDRALSVAAGACNVANDVRTTPYLTCCVGAPSLKVHFGAMRTESHNRWFAGIHKPLSRRVCIMADHISGDENFSAVGLECDLGRGLGLLVGRQFPNGSGDPTLTLHLILAIEP